MKNTSTASTFLAACLIFAPALTAQADCPLEGTWDTGFKTELGHSYTRLVMTFDCEGHTKLTAHAARGKLLHATGAVVERTGTYTIVGPGENAGTHNIDIVIESLQMRYSDPRSIEMVKAGNLSCGDPETVTINEPFPVLGKTCNGAKFPYLGFVEHAVAKFDGDQLYWNKLYGEDGLVIQPPAEDPRRSLVLDETFVFSKTQ